MAVAVTTTPVAWVEVGRFIDIYTGIQSILVIKMKNILKAFLFSLIVISFIPACSENNYQDPEAMKQAQSVSMSNGKEHPVLQKSQVFTREHWTARHQILKQSLLKL